MFFSRYFLALTRITKITKIFYFRIFASSSVSAQEESKNLSIFFSDVILNKYKSLRALAAKVSRPLTDEFRDSNWFNCSNVVLTDFMLGNRRPTGRFF